MIFLGTPNMYIKVTSKPMIRAGFKGFYFDSNGEYFTDNVTIQNYLKLHFTVKEETHKCKKCDFSADSQGKLLAHYKKMHKEE